MLRCDDSKIRLQCYLRLNYWKGKHNLGANHSRKRFFCFTCVVLSHCSCCFWMQLCLVVMEFPLPRKVCKTRQKGGLSGWRMSNNGLLTWVQNPKACFAGSAHMWQRMNHGKHALESLTLEKRKLLWLSWRLWMLLLLLTNQSLGSVAFRKKSWAVSCRRGEAVACRLTYGIFYVKC